MPLLGLLGPLVLGGGAGAGGGPVPGSGGPPAGPLLGLRILLALGFRLALHLHTSSDYLSGFSSDAVQSDQSCLCISNITNVAEPQLFRSALAVQIRNVI